MTAAAALARIREQLERMRALCNTPEAQLFAANERVSGWSPGEHVDHLLRVTNLILHRIPSDEVLPRGISLLGRIILTLGWIPRGIGKAPERLGGRRTSPAELQATLEKVTNVLATIDTAAVDAARAPNVPHPRFGGLTPSQALRFVVIHNDHHLEIVRDVLGMRR